MLQEIKSDLLRISILSGLACILGIILIVVPADVLLWLCFVVLGLAVILFSLPEFIHQIQYFGEEPLYEFLLTCVVMALGFALIFWQEPVLMIIIGILLIGIPLVKIFTCNAKMAMFRTQLPILILGVTLILVGPGKLVNILFDVAGWLIICLALVYFVYSLVFLLPKKKSHAIQREKKNIGDE